jgi:hypothetical protein
METGRQPKVKVALYADDTHFATFDMPTLPRQGDTLEIGFPNQQTVKLFEVERVIHKMIQLPAYETKYVEGVPVQCHVDPPWRWELQLHGSLQEPFVEYEDRKCLCSNTPDEVKCPKHGHQSAGREICPNCLKCYLGYCAQGEYCTSDSCKYVA